jgi:serine O-acetyltransferase
MNFDIEVPHKDIAIEFTDTVIDILFPVFAKYKHKECNQEFLFINLESLLRKLLSPFKDKLTSSVSDICDRFVSALPDVYSMLIKDATAIKNFDPAATNEAEVIIAYPGFWAIAVYRISHILHNMNIPIVPRLISEYAHSKTGIDIHPGAKIGENFFIDHGTGVVIGETCVIKNNVKIYQGVTLGALQVSKDLQNVKRHPTVEDNVIIYSNATILGGKTIIGHDSIIGGNTWLTSSVDANSLVYHSNKQKIRTNKPEKNLDFQI